MLKVKGGFPVLSHAVPLHDNQSSYASRRMITTDGLAGANLADAVCEASLREQIRGFGYVKAASVEALW